MKTSFFNITFPSLNLNISPGFSYSMINYNNSESNYSIFNNTTIQKEREELTSIIGIGDCIVDIIAEIDPQIKDAYELQNDKTKYINENTKDIFNELETMSCVHYIPGGSNQNTLRVLSWVLRQNYSKSYIFNINENNNLEFKYKISMLGSVGKDKYKDQIISSLIQSGVNPYLQLINDKTSRCAAGTINKRPFLISDIKASKYLDKDFIISNKEEILNHDILIIEGYYLQYQYELCETLCELFKQEENKLIILTLSPISLNKILLNKFINISNHADIIFSGKSQLENFVYLKGVDNIKIFEKFFQILSKDKNRLLIVKDGKEAAYCIKYNYLENHLESILTSFPEQISNEEIRDEIGFEDAFLGGFLAEYMKGNSLYSCLKKGNDIANVILKNIGCSFKIKK